MANERLTNEQIEYLRKLCRRRGDKLTVGDTIYLQMNVPLALTEIEETRTPCVLTYKRFGDLWAYKTSCGKVLESMEAIHESKFCLGCGHPVRVEEKKT